ncbi:MAG: hypothetical protein WC120_05450 [Parcubacteria group bacterium]|jgi:hypothetical protein
MIFLLRKRAGGFSVDEVIDGVPTGAKMIRSYFPSGGRVVYRTYEYATSDRNHGIAILKHATPARKRRT